MASEYLKACELELEWTSRKGYRLTVVDMTSTAGASYLNAPAFPPSTFSMLGSVKDHHTPNPTWENRNGCRVHRYIHNAPASYPSSGKDGSGAHPGPDKTDRSTPSPPTAGVRKANSAPDRACPAALSSTNSALRSPAGE